MTIEVVPNPSITPADLAALADQEKWITTLEGQIDDHKEQGKELKKQLQEALERLRVLVREISEPSLFSGEEEAP